MDGYRYRYSTDFRCHYAFTSTHTPTQNNNNNNNKFSSRKEGSTQANEDEYYERMGEATSSRARCAMSLAYQVPRNGSECMRS